MHAFGLCGRMWCVFTAKLFYTLSKPINHVCIAYIGIADHQLCEEWSHRMQSDHLYLGRKYFPCSFSKLSTSQWHNPLNYPHSTHRPIYGIRHPSHATDLVNTARKFGFCSWRGQARMEGGWVMGHFAITDYICAALGIVVNGVQMTHH